MVKKLDFIYSRICYIWWVLGNFVICLFIVREVLLLDGEVVFVSSRIWVFFCYNLVYIFWVVGKVGVWVSFLRMYIGVFILKLK